MSANTYSLSLLAATIIFNPFPDISASTINALNVPLVVRNGTGPIDLSCVYDVRESENGLVVKWYHDTKQIYQWIPPMPPQDVGVIYGLTEYPEKNLKRPNSRSIIRLKLATVEMGGEYTCAISTFQEEDSRRSRMIVYVPENRTTIRVSPFNETHSKLTCAVQGAQPRPVLRFYVEGVEIEATSDEIEEAGEDGENFSVKKRAIAKNSLEPTLVECEISIPYTDYRRRERIVYYPTRSSFQRSSARGRFQTTLNIIFIILLQEFL